MSRDYKTEVLQLLIEAGKWVNVEEIHNAMRNPSAIYRPWGHVSKALVELEAAGLIEYSQKHDGEIWRVKNEK